MTTGIMNRPAVTVDVQEMLCAQALARADREIRAIPIGAAMGVVCNATDVRDDLLVWAREMGHTIMKQQQLASQFHVWIQRGR